MLCKSVAIDGKSKRRKNEFVDGINSNVFPKIDYKGPALKYSLSSDKDGCLTIIARSINCNTPYTMAKSKRCTDRDISMLLETDSDSDSKESDKNYSMSTDNDTSDVSSSEKIFDNNKSLLLQKKDALRKKQTSLRIKLRRSTEQSLYKIDTDSEDERPKRSTRSMKYQAEKLQNESETPRRSTRIIKLPKKYSDYKYDNKSQMPISQKLNYNEEALFLASLDADSKSTAKKHANNENSAHYTDSSDCVCVRVLPNTKLTRSNTTPKTNKQTNKQKHVSSLDIDNNNDNNINTPRSTRSSKRILTDRIKENNINKISLNEETETNNIEEMQDASFCTTPKKKSRIERSGSKITLIASNKPELTILENENKDNFDEVTVICENTKGLSLRNKRNNKNTKNATESVIKNGMATPRSRVKYSALTPSVKMRTTALAKPMTPLQEARSRLHVNMVPKSLPCREEEFNNIYTFLEGKLFDEIGGCIYISGVPGTGKTATVNEVVKCLKRSVEKDKLNHFEFIEINGMKLSEPRQVYVQMHKQLSGKVLTWEQAHNALEKRFNSKTKRPMTLLLIDELDLLCTKRQDVVYNLLEWPTKASAQLIVITIANTMDLPERVLMGRVSSRLGLTRVTFQPYNHKQLQEIILTRLKNSDIFKGETIQLIARKVSAVSGDARRALDICRRATEISEIRGSTTVTMEDVDNTLSEMIINPKVQAIKHCSIMEQMFLQAVCAELTRIGTEEVCFKNVYQQFNSLCILDGLEIPNITQTFGICTRLGDYRLLICEDPRNDIYQKILLNVSKDDIHYALQQVDLRDI